MLYTASGQPAESPELLRRLHAIDDGLSLRWFGTYWGVMFRWPQTDARWIEVREGRLSEETARIGDMICALPPDCSADQAPSYIESRCRDWGKAGRHDIAKLLDRIHEANAKQQASVDNDIADFTEELVRANAETIFEEFGKTTARVYQSESHDTKKGRKRRKWSPVE